jgi:hypothetical protein
MAQPVSKLPRIRPRAADIRTARLREIRERNERAKAERRARVLEEFGSDPHLSR